MKHQVNMTATEGTNKAPTTDARQMETYELSDKEIKIILLKVSGLQEHTANYTKSGKQYMNKMRCSTKKQKPLKK